jgi:GTP diphosphokinase / guanosine-3',5'-bis(diphosphate) 3'-diphosphatase
MPTSTALPAQTAEPAAQAAAASFHALVEQLGYLNPEDIEQVRKAYRLADEAHLGITRKSGEPYITHPIAVAIQCAQWKLDAQAIMAALLHDVIEDTGISKTSLVEKFGSSVAELVDGLTKLDKLNFNTKEEGQSESFRKMLLAMAQDVRVILVKLADRWHNMQTLGSMPTNRRKAISAETLEIYAPIANRLGLNQAYRELQELAFQHLNPWRHQVLEKAVIRSRKRRSDLMRVVEEAVKKAFDQAGIKAQIEFREKTLYSIYKKMESKHLSFAQVTDIFGMRLVVPESIDCYTGLGLLHQLYKPVPGRFKDHIAIPKVNGYQSLHTTVVGPAGVNIEFQMRTEDMHRVAEAGVAAHWLYKTNVKDPSGREQQGTLWLQSLLDIQSETRDAAEFWDHIKVDLFPDAVYVFTPKGRIMALPRGATVVDFAYAVHSNVGDCAIAAKVNGSQVPLRTELSNGNVVEVITSVVPAPNPAWLGFVRTGRARSKIRHFLKTRAQAEAPALGEKLLIQAVRAEGLEQLPALDKANADIWDKLLRFTGARNQAELFTDIGMGKRVASIVAKRLVALMMDSGLKPDPLLISKERFTAHETLSQGSVTIDGGENASVQFGRCCHPIPGDDILGYLGRGEGLVIHRQSCESAQRLQSKDSERFMAVEWSDEPVRSFEVPLIVTVNNGKGVLARIASSIASSEADINQVNMPDEVRGHEVTEMKFLISVDHLEHLESVMRNLGWIPSVTSVRRG